MKVYHEEDWLSSEGLVAYDDLAIYVLSTIRAAGGMSVVQIAKETGIPEAMARVNIAFLALEDFVAVEQDSIEITARGERLISEFGPEVNLILDDHSSGGSERGSNEELPPSETERLRKYMEKEIKRIDERGTSGFSSEEKEILDSILISEDHFGKR